MQPYAATMARNGFLALTYDSLGHGRNPVPMGGDITREDGATLRLLDELAAVVDFARSLPGGDGRVALLGHSMAADIVVRQAMADPAVAATVAVSMFSPMPTAESPRDLLVIVGDWEPPLKDEALRVLRLAAGEAAGPGVTYEGLGAAGARRVAFAPQVEHIGVLYSPAAMAEAAAWVSRAFGMPGTGKADARGPWVLLLILATVALGWPLAGLLPVLNRPRAGHGVRGWRLWALALGPAVLVPLVLTRFEVRFLPVLVGDYLALHFALYGVLTAVGLRLLGGREAFEGVVPPRPRAALAAAVAVAAFGAFGIGAAVEAQVSAFWPTLGRMGLLLALLPGTLLYFVADEWATRGEGSAPWAYAVTKLCFLGSLALAVALDLPRLFFLIILAPALVLFFIVFGLVSYWADARTGHPAVGGAANALIFAMAIAVTFPLVAG
jgi:dienelactone hydrolase